MAGWTLIDGLLSPLRALRRRRSHRLGLQLGNRPASHSAARGSFGWLVDERKRWLFDVLPPASAETHWNLFDKRSQKALARRLGLSVAEDYVVGLPLSEALDAIERRALERFVIKPVLSHSAKGCRALVRERAGFVDVATGRRWHRRGLERVLRRDVIAGRDDVWLVEEMLHPFSGRLEPIEDVKLYCFGGTVELVLLKRPRQGAKGYEGQFYTRDWEPVNVGLEDREEPMTHIPINGRRLIEAAELAASQLCHPFIRIDLYDAHRGVILGEFTPGPGRRYGFNATWDAYLVGRWHEAAASIEQGIRSGRIVPLGAEASPSRART